MPPAKELAPSLMFQITLSEPSRLLLNCQVSDEKIWLIRVETHCPSPESDCVRYVFLQQQKPEPCPAWTFHLCVGSDSPVTTDVNPHVSQ